MTLRSPQVVVDVTVSPARAGRNDIHVSTFSRAGAPLDVAEVTVTFDLPSRDIAPITVPLRDLGPGHYLSPGFDIPLSGDWRVTTKVRLTDVDQVTRTGTIPIAIARRRSLGGLPRFDSTYSVTARFAAAERALDAGLHELVVVLRDEAVHPLLEQRAHHRVEDVVLLVERHLGAAVAEVLELLPAHRL